MNDRDAGIRAVTTARRTHALSSERSLGRCSTRACKSPPEVASLNLGGDAAAMPVDEAALAMSKNLVRDDEIIILLLRPSLWYVPLSSMGGLVFIALVTFALAYMARLPWVGWSDIHAFALGVSLAALRLGWQMLEWINRVYVLTDRRVITRSGVLRVIVFQTQLKNIQHTSIFASMRERALGLGTIGFATAGSDTFETFWTMIRQPFAVHSIVTDAIERYGR